VDDRLLLLYRIPTFCLLSEGTHVSLNDSSSFYAIVRYNSRTYRPGGVVLVVKGKQQAESAVKQFQEALSSSEYQEGWRYFFEKTSLKAGTDPAEATNLRQAELESRETKAPPEEKNSADD